MRTLKEIEISEKIHEKRALQIKLSKWEAEKAFEIQALIKQQALIEDDIIILEWELSQVIRPEMEKSDSLWKIKKLLAELGF